MFASAPTQTASAETAPSRSALQLVRALCVVAAFAACNSLSSALSEHFGTGSLGWSSPLKLAFSGLGWAVRLSGIVWLGCVVLGGTSLRALGWRLERPLRLLGLGLAQAALLVGLVFAAYFVLGGTEGVRDLARALATMPLSERVAFLILGAMVAFTEETVFRGDLLQRMSNRWSVPVAIVASSVVFAFYHRTLSPVSLVMKAMFGVIFALFTLRSKSLVPSAIGHTLMWAIVGEN